MYCFALKGEEPSENVWQWKSSFWSHCVTMWCALLFILLLLSLVTIFLLSPPLLSLSLLPSLIPLLMFCCIFQGLVRLLLVSQQHAPSGKGAWCYAHQVSFTLLYLYNVLLECVCCYYGHCTVSFWAFLKLISLAVADKNAVVCADPHCRREKKKLLDEKKNKKIRSKGGIEPLWR